MKEGVERNVVEGMHAKTNLRALRTRKDQEVYANIQPGVLRDEQPIARSSSFAILGSAADAKRVCALGVLWRWDEER
jgi:hypothetical protein